LQSWRKQVERLSKKYQENPSRAIEARLINSDFSAKIGSEVFSRGKSNTALTI
jgi:hypothetical protein